MKVRGQCEDCGGTLVSRKRKATPAIPIEVEEIFCMNCDERNASKAPVPDTGENRFADERDI